MHESFRKIPLRLSEICIFVLIIINNQYSYILKALTMKLNSYLIILLVFHIISFNLNGQSMSGDYSVGGGASIPGQFINFTNPLNSAGTISCNTNSLIVTGNSTSFLTLFKVDDVIYDAGGWVCGVAIGQIVSIESNTKLTLSANASKTLTAGSKYCGPDAPGAFAAINNCGLSDNVNLTLNGAVNEPGTTSLKKWTESGAGGYKLNINCFWNNLIVGNNATGLIKLDGCSNVTFSGGDPWGNYMTFRNDNNTGACLVFINGAQNNKIENCSFENRNTTVAAGSNMGAILFSTSTGPNGNSNNIINNCIIRDRSDLTGVLAHEGICSQGTAAYPNSNNTISNCSFDNIENYGIWITNTGNGDGWNIKGNIFYWDKTTAATTAQAGIYFNSSTSNGNKIINNYIGRDGPPYFYGEWPNSGNVAFTGIYINAGTGSVTRCDSNNVAHVRLTSSSSTNLYGIQIAGGSVDVKNNGVGDGFWLYVGPQDTYTLAGTGNLIGIYVTGGTDINIENNAIYALTKTNASGTLTGIGITATAVAARIVGNIVNSLTGSGSVVGVGNLSSVCGIYNYATNSDQYIYNNTISGLENTYVGNNVVSITGIALKGPIIGSSICAKSNIYIDGNCRNGATLNFANLVGIDIQGAVYDIVNNMMMLGYDNFWYENSNPYIISGIKKSTTTYINNIYYNSIFIVGTSNSTTARNTYCYNALAGTGVADNIMNNIFFNGRTNTGALGTHYALFYNSTSETFDYNDYFVTGTGGKLSNGNLALPLKAGQDAHSLNVDPDYVEEHCQPCPWNNLHILNGCSLNGKGFDLSSNIPPYTEDIDGEIRSTGLNKPDIGADEFAIKAPIFTKQPKDTIIGCGGADSVKFNAATASGVSLNYKWQVSNDGNIWSDIIDGGSNPEYIGSTSMTLTAKGVASALQFRCLADSCGQIAASNTAKIILGGAAPTNLVLTATPSTPPHEGDNVVIKASVDPANPATSYTWWIISGTIVTDPNTSNTLTLNNVPYNGDGIRGAGVTWIMVRANNACGSSSAVFHFLNIIPKTASASPSTCGGNDGYIELTGLLAQYEYDITYKKNGVVQTPLILNSDNNGVVTIGNLTGGTYTDILLYLNRGCGGCTTNSAPADTIVLSGQTLDISYLTPDKSKCIGDSALFKVTALGNNLSYKWYHNSTQLAETSDQIVLNNLSAMDAGTYNCVVTNTCSSYTTAGSSLKVSSSIIISDPISNLSECEGNNIAFTASASGGELTYQWTKSSIGKIAGATNYIYTITNIKKSDGDIYSCIISNPCGSKNIPGFIFNVNEIPVISISPLTQTKKTGESVNYTLSPTGGTVFSFQWAKNNTLIEGATSATYSVDSLKMSDAGEYTCVITNICGSITATSGTLIIIEDIRYKLQGQVVYDNNSRTPLKNSTVYLKDEYGENMDTTITDDKGAYLFSNLKNGIYKLTAFPSMPWGGGTPTDALYISKYFVKIYSFQDELKQKAADVNNDQSINSTDGLIINKRFVKFINKFTVPDWISEEPVFLINGSDALQDVKVVCTGDVDGSYIF